MLLHTCRDEKPRNEVTYVIHNCTSMNNDIQHNPPIEQSMLIIVGLVLRNTVMFDVLILEMSLLVRAKKYEQHLQPACG